MSSSVTSSFWARSIKGVELVKVMVSVLPVSPWREERLRQVSHVSLTDRGQPELLACSFVAERCALAAPLVLHGVRPSVLQGRHWENQRSASRRADVRFESSSSRTRPGLANASDGSSLGRIGSR